MNTLTRYLNTPQARLVGNALYHEGLGYLDKPCFVANVPAMIGSPHEPQRVYEVIEAVLDGSYRGYLEKCDRENCICREGF